MLGSGRKKQLGSHDCGVKALLRAEFQSPLQVKDDGVDLCPTLEVRTLVAPAGLIMQGEIMPGPSYKISESRAP